MHIVKQKEIDKKKTHNLKVLLAGESWITHSIHIKGFDTFTTSEYSEGGTYLIKGLEKNEICVDFLPNHLAPTKFPSSLDELNNYDVIILSDIGSNTLYLHPETFSTSRIKPNRLELLVSRQPCNVVNNVVYFLHNQIRRIGYEEIHRDTYRRRT